MVLPGPAQASRTLSERQACSSSDPKSTSHSSEEPERAKTHVHQVADHKGPALLGRAALFRFEQVKLAAEREKVRKQAVEVPLHAQVQVDLVVGVVQVSKDPEQLGVDVARDRGKVGRELAAGFGREDGFVLDQAFDPGQDIVDVLRGGELDSFSARVDPGVIHAVGRARLGQSRLMRVTAAESFPRRSDSLPRPCRHGRVAIDGAELGDDRVVQVQVVEEVDHWARARRAKESARGAHIAYRRASERATCVCVCVHSRLTATHSLTSTSGKKGPPVCISEPVPSKAGGREQICR